MQNWMVCVKISGRLRIMPGDADAVIPAEAGGQEPSEVSWIPAPDRVEGTLFAGMTRAIASQGGIQGQIPLPENIHRYIA